MKITKRVSKQTESSTEPDVETSLLTVALFEVLMLSPLPLLAF
jgi:hypothetical protein